MEIVIAFIVCLVPSLVLFFWIRNLQKDKPGYTDGCNMSLINGILSTFLVLVLAGILNLLGNLAGIGNRETIPGALFCCFVLYALTEETSKFLFFKRTLKKTSCCVSWYDAAVFMTLVGVGFGLLESAVYSLTMGVGQAVIRGLSVAHGGYGFIMGYFYGKAVKTGKKGYYIVSFMFPYLIHALYDFSLSPILGDNLVFTFTAVILAAFDFVVLVIMIIFFKRRKNDERYTAPLREPAE